VINNCYGNNDVALQTAWCDLGKPNIYLIHAGDTVHSIWAQIQALINVLTAKTEGHKMLEWSQLIILATALKSINPVCEAQFNALLDDMPMDAILKALNCVEALHHATSGPEAVLYTGQGHQQHGCQVFQHWQAPHSMFVPHAPQWNLAGSCLHYQHDNWSGDKGKWCSLHNLNSHSLKECHEAAAQGLIAAPAQATPPTTHTAALTTMTAAAIMATATLPPHTPQSSVLAAMTTTTATARPRNFAIVSESVTGTTTAFSEPTPINKPFPNYSVFSLVALVDLPTIANTGAMQHTTNRRDLLHDFIPLAMPLRLVCANGGYIECLGHGTLCGTTTVNGVPSSIVMCNIAFVPGVLHTLILPQQLLYSGCCIMFDQQNSFLFYLNEQLRLFSY
jgi:hypothetical protein